MSSLHASDDAVATAGQVSPGGVPIAQGSVTLYMMVEEYIDKQTGIVSLRPSREPPPRRIKNASFEQYCFNIIHIPDSSRNGIPKRMVEINSTHLKSICRRVMGDGVCWSSSPLRIESIVFFPHYNRLKDSLETLKAENPDASGTQHLELLVSFLYVEHFTRILELDDLTARGEITFDLLNCILLPETILFTLCRNTQEPLACRLINISRDVNWDRWRITADYVEANGDSACSGAGAPFGHARLVLYLEKFQGSVPIRSLDVYPLHMHPRQAELSRQLVSRGRRWAGFAGVLQKHYDGVVDMGKVVISSRIVLDRKMYYQGYGGPLPMRVKSRSPSFDSGRDEDHSDHGWSSDEDDSSILTDEDYISEMPKLHTMFYVLSDEDAMMTPAFVYGFSLENKRWLRLKVEHITDINWREEAFDRLVLPESQKTLIKCLVEAQVKIGAGLEDVVEGKGRGLVLNLSGPAGVGKTLTAEAASEHMKLPLYVAGSGDLGNSPSELDKALRGIFKLSSAWGAIVVIDEADVYLEQRSADEQQRNAFVSVFLRRLEYFNGVLFLTTSRVRALDAAFQSRIHVSLHYPGLDENARRALWRGFVGDVHGELTPAEAAALAAIPLNGRQIKNAVQSASAVASGVDEKVAFKHIKDVVELIRQFEENTVDK